MERISFLYGPQGPYFLSVSLRQFVATKLYIPPSRPKTVHRSRLIEKLNEGLHRKLTLIAAPAGYGKTTLVTEWIDQIQKDTACTEHAEVTVCWLSLDEDESDSQLFFSYLAAAIQPLPDAQSTLPPLLQPPQPLPTKSLMTAFVNDLISVSTPFHLILDDYHAIDSPDVTVHPPQKE